MPQPGYNPGLPRNATCVSLRFEPPPSRDQIRSLPRPRHKIRSRNPLLHTGWVWIPVRIGIRSRDGEGRRPNLTCFPNPGLSLCDETEAIPVSLGLSMSFCVRLGLCTCPSCPPPRASGGLSINPFSFDPTPGPGYGCGRLASASLLRQGHFPA